ncbi:hypothetical protein C8R44DRAFT_821646, partial [Mycena epipterygia]
MSLNIISSYFDTETLKFIISVKPSPDLVSLLQSLNPDFLFSILSRLDSRSDILNAVLGWLDEIHPCAQGLLELWEDYDFMLRCDYIWSYQSTSSSHLISYDYDYGKILSQAPSQLLKILHSFAITQGNNGTMFVRSLSLVSTHFLLDLSWDELRKSICPLWKIMGKYKGKLDELLIYNYASDSSLCPKPASIFSDLSRGYLRVMRSCLDHKWPRYFRSHVVGDKWGGVLRSCPPCDDMLRDLRELEFASTGTSLFDYTGSDNFHNILQWLKTFSKRPDDLIARFEHHLERRKIDYGSGKSFGELEEDWMSWRKKM